MINAKIVNQKLIFLDNRARIYVEGKPIPINYPITTLKDRIK